MGKNHMKTDTVIGTLGSADSIVRLRKWRVHSPERGPSLDSYLRRQISFIGV